ncbi:MAG TPA: hypothetical protein VEW93_05760 [Acidimicrobiales bacterium]|nr:hypothetical protein [Acidimicrobiales bacterium]
MKQSIDAAFDEHEGSEDENLPPAWWMVNVVDDCEGCDDLRVELVLERPGGDERVAAHLGPAAARRLRAALATALSTVGQEP